MTEKVHKLIKAICITLLAWVLSLLLMQPFAFSIFNFFQSTTKSEVSVSDLYAQVADSRKVRRLVKDIVIINIDKADRYDIAEILKKLSKAGVRGIGLDVIFSDKFSDRDSVLVESVFSTPKLVIAEKLSGDKPYKTEDGSFFRDSLPQTARIGVINFYTAEDYAPIREMKLDFETEEGQRPAFSKALAEVCGIDISKALNDDEELMKIDYPSKEYVILQPEELDKALPDLKNKIILIGGLTEKSDLHYTPVSRERAGVLIHADSLSTMNEGVNLHEVTDVVNWFFAFLLCFIVIFVGFMVNPKIKGVLTRLLQILFVVMAVWIGYRLYLDRHIIMNWGFCLMMVTFGLFATDLWMGGELLVNTICKKIKRTH